MHTWTVVMYEVGDIIRRNEEKRDNWLDKLFAVDKTSASVIQSYIILKNHIRGSEGRVFTGRYAPESVDDEMLSQAETSLVEAANAGNNEAAAVLNMIKSGHIKALKYIYTPIIYVDWGAAVSSTRYKHVDQ